MNRIIAANGKTVFAKNEDVYTVMAGDDGNDYIVELENNSKIWNTYMPPEESEDELICFEGPILALPNVKIEPAKNTTTDNSEPIKFLPPPKKKTLTFKPTDSLKFSNNLEKEKYEEILPQKKKLVKKKQT